MKISQWTLKGQERLQVCSYWVIFLILLSPSTLSCLFTLFWGPTLHSVNYLDCHLFSTTTQSHVTKKLELIPYLKTSAGDRWSSMSFFLILNYKQHIKTSWRKKQYIYNTIHTNTYTQITLMFSQDDIQLVMYIRTNSFGSSTAVVSLFTTSMECRLMSMLTRTVKYLDRHLHVYVHGKRNFACYKKIVDWVKQKSNWFIKHILRNFRRIYQLRQNLDSNKRIVFHQFLKLKQLKVKAA